jgi:hypothetical protein
MRSVTAASFQLKDLGSMAAVWSFCVFFFGGLAGAIALIEGKVGSQVANDAALGAAAGFIIGVPVTIVACVFLIAT